MVSLDDENLKKYEGVAYFTKVARPRRTYAYALKHNLMSRATKKY